MWADCDSYLGENLKEREREDFMNVCVCGDEVMWQTSYAYIFPADES